MTNNNKAIYRAGVVCHHLANNFFFAEFNPIEHCYRDISSRNRKLNVAGKVGGFDKRILKSYEEITVERIRKYFLSSDKICQLYENGDETSAVLDKLKEARKSHRQCLGSERDRERPKYERKRDITLKLFDGTIVKFKDIPKIKPP